MEQTEIERETLAGLVNLAVQSLVGGLLVSGSYRGGTVFYLSDNFYSESNLGRATINYNLKGDEYPEDIRKFVGTKSDALILGFVPVTKEAKKVLDELGLKVVIEGATLLPEGITFQVYK